MPNVLLPQRAPQQTVYPSEVNRSNPLGRKLIEYFPLNGFYGSPVTGNRPTLTASGSWQGTGRGQCLRGDGNVNAASINLDLSGYDQITISFWMWWDAYAENDDYGYTLSSPNSTGCIWLDVNSTGPHAGEMYFGYSSASGQAAHTGIARPAASKWHHYVGCFDNRLNGPGFAIYVDGAPVTMNETQPQATSGTFASGPLYLLGINGAIGGAAFMENMAFFKGLLTEAEAKSLYAKPYQFLTPRPRLRTVDMLSEAFTVVPSVGLLGAGF